MTKTFTPKVLTIILTGLLILTTTLAMGQRGNRGGRSGGTPPQITVKGTVIDAQSQTALEFATISLYSMRDSSLVTGGLTDATGDFAFQSRMGRMYAVIEFISYEAQYLEVPFDRDAIRSGSRVIDMGQIGLVVSGIALDDIEIRAEKSETQFSLDKRVFNVGKDLANQGGTAQDILDNVPSVTVDIEGAVSLRGSEGVRIIMPMVSERYRLILSNL